MNSTRIKQIDARQILDCKCRPIIEVDVMTEGGHTGCGSSPTGSSVGLHESFVLRDGDAKEYDGLSVHKAVDIIKNVISPVLIGMDVRDQSAIDNKMIALDGTPDKHRLGGNSIYSISIACFRAAAAAANMPLYEYIAGGAEEIKTVPVPSFNMINGGKYSTHIQPFNEFILIPYKAEDIFQAVEMSVKIYHKIESVIQDYYNIKPGIGSSYGWIAPSEDPEQNLKLLAEAADRCGYLDKVAFALDCASSEMYDKKTRTYYLLGKQIGSDQMIEYVKGITERWQIVFVEDLLDEDDWDGYAKAHSVLKRTLIFGDDFTATNKTRIARAHKEQSIDGFILKPNQAGTITEALDAYAFAKQKQLIATPSGRSGGVLGDVIMDLGVGLQTPFQKNGCPKSGERIEKLNFLMRICDKYRNCKMSDLSSLVRF